MIGHATDCFRHPIHLANHAAEISVKPVAPRRSDLRFALLRTEKDMVVQTQVRRRHGRMFPAPLPGRTPFVRTNPAVLPPANVHASLRDAGPDHRET